MFYNKGLLVIISLMALISVRAVHAGMRVYRPGSSFRSTDLGYQPGGSQRVFRTSQRNSHRRATVAEESRYSVSRPLQHSRGYKPQRTYAGEALMDNRVNGYRQNRRYRRPYNNPNRRYDPYGRRFGRRVVYANAGYGAGYGFRGYGMGSFGRTRRPAFSLQLAPASTSKSTRSSASVRRR